MDFHFPFAETRNFQEEFMSQVYSTLDKGGQMLVHAPTGIGKTAAVLSPAITYITKKDKKKVIFFLTSRNTQHLIAVETLKQIKNKFDLSFVTVDLVGKKGMCNQPGVHLLSAGEFNEYCKDVREKGKCEFYTNLKFKNKPSPRLVNVITKLKAESPMHVEEINSTCKNSDLCSYEVACQMGKDAQVIIADYNFVMHPHIRDSLLRRINKNMEDLIVIFDEAHNIPSRARDILTAKINTYILDSAAKEARLFRYDEMAEDIIAIKNILIELNREKVPIDKHEATISKDEFFKKVEAIGNYEEIMGNFEFIGEQVLESKRRSFCASLASFMEHWIGPNEGFTRIINKSFSKNKKIVIEIHYRCLDPSLVMKSVIDQAHAVVTMSGTLTPIDMYSNLLGFDPDNTLQVEYKDPFPPENRLNLVVPGTSTKFKSRSELMYNLIAKKCAEVTNKVPGNAVIFFPSYYLRDQIFEYLRDKSDKTMFLEDTEYTKEQRGDLLEKFKEYKDQGAILLGVSGGSFSEGIDLPGDLLHAVIVVGVPLAKPDLETQELITYYDKRFGRGWDYGYVFPAIIKILQSAGRCIRSETDRGVVVFMDDRYTWQSYRRCFPSEMIMSTKNDPGPSISSFFNGSI